MKTKFRHFVGADLANKNIAVYSDENNDRVLVLEKNGDEIDRVTISAETYKSLRDDWDEGGKISEDDARITHRAIEWFYTIRDIELRGAPSGNQNARKHDADKASSFIHARCLPGDKAKWVKAAQANGMKLTEWIIEALNEKAINARPTETQI
jgi:PHD/YefM family antitoxin component YafN of YafNO toxin-antitoxin module